VIVVSPVFVTGCLQPQALKMEEMRSSRSTTFVPWRSNVLRAMSIMPRRLTRSLSKRYKRSAGYVGRTMQHTVLIMPQLQSSQQWGNAYRLQSPVAVALWKQLRRPATVHELCTGLLQQFDTTQVSARRDIQKFLKELVVLGVVQET
jgi:hypothetical protein